MSDPISLTARSPRHALPFLFAGQAQKEFTVNQAVAQLDFLVHPVVEGESAAPPAAPLAGQSWLVAAGATGEWTGSDRRLACWDGNQWLFAAPVLGMQVFDRTLGARWRFDGQWKRVLRPAAPTGGNVVDVQARATIATVLDSLQAAGIFSAG